MYLGILDPYLQSLLFSVPTIRPHIRKTWYTLIAVGNIFWILKAKVVCISIPAEVSEELCLGEIGVSLVICCLGTAYSAGQFFSNCLLEPTSSDSMYLIIKLGVKTLSTERAVFTCSRPTSAALC